MFQGVEVGFAKKISTCKVGGGSEVWLVHSVIKIRRWRRYLADEQVKDSDGSPKST